MRLRTRVRVIEGISVECSQEFSVYGSRCLSSDATMHIQVYTDTRVSTNTNLEERMYRELSDASTCLPSCFQHGAGFGTYMRTTQVR